MRKLIIHIGYPKTGTTSLQDGVFVNLHKQGKINFLGRSQYDKNNAFLQAPALSEYLWNYPEPDNINISLSDDLLNIISDEVFTFPRAYREAEWGYTMQDPFTFPAKLKTCLQGIADDVNIVVTLRCQKDVMPSFYVQKFMSWRDDENHNTPSKHFFGSTNHINKDLFGVYYYHDLLKKWADAFGKNSLNVLFYEDLTNDFDAFSKELSTITDLPGSEIESLLQGVHYRKTPMGDTGYIYEKKHHTVAGGIVEKLFSIPWIKQTTKMIKKRFGLENNKLVKMLKKPLFPKEEFIIPPLTAQQENMIVNEFRENNLLLAKEFGLSREKMETYGYI